MSDFDLDYGFTDEDAEDLIDSFYDAIYEIDQEKDRTGN